MRRLLAIIFRYRAPLAATDAQATRLLAAQREAKATQLRKAMLAAEVHATIRRLQRQA